MKLSTFSVVNFRRLNRVNVNLESKTTVFVGANNSGKTSATHLFKLMLGKTADKFTVHDFSASCWSDFCDAGEAELEVDENGNVISFPELPKISLDLWLKVDPENIHNVVDLLPDLDWQETPIGVRISFEPKNAEELLKDYEQARTQTAEQGGDVEKTSGSDGTYTPWPKDVFDFLNRNILKYYSLKHYVLDHSTLDADGFIPDGAELRSLGDKEKSGAKIIGELIRVDYLNAQRHLSDDSQSDRGQNLSKRFSKFYQRNLDQKEDDFDTVKMLAEAQEGLDDHFANVFADTLSKLEALGYPGIENPHIVIKSVLSADSVLSKDTHIQYDLGGGTSAEPFSLPDKYNGLGFKNLIFMLVELLDFQADWIATKDNRPLLHLIFIEEPEAHLHAQLQKVFIDKIRVATGADDEGLFEQYVVTTHSSHILYNSGFQPVRYFRRKGKSHDQATDILDLSKYSNDENPDDIAFLQRYMKLTHCDLFFADAAILVEGNVERLLLPLFVEKSAQPLLSRYVSILEVGGAHIHRFLPLLKFLGLQTLLITDIDSVDPNNNRGGCATWLKDAETGNSLLRNHFPKLKKISELEALDASNKEKSLCHETGAKLRVAYQHPLEIKIGNETSTEFFGRTFEEQFAFENFDWLQEEKQKNLGLSTDDATLAERCNELHLRVRKDFKKADFALELMSLEKSQWNTPRYIGDGLSWLSDQLAEDVNDEPQTK
jgi:predicted ATP-dependent endonuclease of OLD family